ncbi:exosome complex exonuclease Rrp41 [Methanosarcina sp.]|uniref:exosome complex exonuclease Rrp41 n=1 Tax=Methanosarcina sp. TaxID=2213 RepID=UPI003BB602DB
MSDKPEKLIADDGLRLDGRRADEIRPMKIEIGVLSRADGSCYLEWGRNKILVGVFGPREAHPRRTQRPDTAVIRYRYNMASFSVEDRARPGPSRRSIEISKVSREAFEPVIMTELFPKTAIDIFVEVLQADAGTRTAAINASSIALADAGIPMKGLITSCAFGKVDGQIVLDLNKEEDNYGDADFPVAMTQDGEITLLQMDGHLTPEEIKKGLELVKKGCKEILEIQQAVLRKKFETPVEEPEGEAAETAEAENKAVEAEASIESSSKTVVVEELIEEAEEFKEEISEETVLAEVCSAEEISDVEELKEIIEEAETRSGEDILEEVIEAEVEEEAEEEAFEDEAEFEASFEASFEEVSEPEEVEELEAEETVSGREETEFESEDFTEEESQLEDEGGSEEITSEEAFESDLEIESEAKSRKELSAEETVEEKAEETGEKAEEAGEAEEEKSEGPWKVVKDPSEAGSRGENNE